MKNSRNVFLLAVLVFWVAFFNCSKSIYLGKERGTEFQSEGGAKHEKEMYLEPTLPDLHFTSSGWAEFANSTISVSGLGISVDSKGNIYVTGQFGGTTRFGPFTLSAKGSQDIFIAKLDNKGKWLWVKQAGVIKIPVGSHKIAGGSSIAVDHNDAILADYRTKMRI